MYGRGGNHGPLEICISLAFAYLLNFLLLLDVSSFFFSVFWPDLVCELVVPPVLRNDQVLLMHDVGFS